MKLIVTILFFGLINFGCKNEKKDFIDNTSKQENLIKKKFDSLVISKIDFTQIPKDISFLGKFKQGFKWTDLNGENIVFLTETGIFKDKNIKREFEESADAELYAYCYNLSNNTPTINWKINDFIRDCPVDIKVNFIDNSLKVTDLNKNGIAEIWTIYKIVCRGDVSPSDMKIIMYEGDQKFAMRGENKVQIGIDDNDKPLYMGGEYKMDEYFKKGPDVFRNFAEKLWNQNTTETWK